MNGRDYLKNSLFASAAFTFGFQTQRIYGYKGPKDGDLKSALEILELWDEKPEHELEIYSAIYEALGEGQNTTFATVAGSAKVQDLCKKHGVFHLGGPMLGCLSADGARVWVRTVEPAKVEVRVSIGDKEKTFGPVMSTLESDLTAIVELSGLPAGTSSPYKVFVDNQQLKLSTKTQITTPPSDTSQVSRIAFGTCQHRWGLGHIDLAETLLERNPLGVLMYGDMAVQDRREDLGMHRADYALRDFHRAWQDVAATTPVYASLDDHDYFDNNKGGIPQGYTDDDRRGVRNVFTQSWNNKYYGMDDESGGIFHHTEIGPCDVIMTDNRYFRTRKGEKNSFLGLQQMDWVKKTLLAYKSPFIILSCGTMWSDYVSGGQDSWGTWDPDGREEILSFIEENAIGGVLLISGDRHGARGVKIPRKSGFHFHEFEPASLGGRGGPPAISEKWNTQLYGFNDKFAFGEFSFDLSKEDPMVTFRLIEAGGESLYELELKCSQLTPGEPSGALGAPCGADAVENTEEEVFDESQPKEEEKVVENPDLTPTEHEEVEEEAEEGVDTEGQEGVVGEPKEVEEDAAEEAEEEAEEEVVNGSQPEEEEEVVEVSDLSPTEDEEVEEEAEEKTQKEVDTRGDEEVAEEADEVERGPAEETEEEVVDEPRPGIQRWGDLTPGTQKALAALGYDESTWDGGSKVPADTRTWDELSQAERFTVFFSLGYTKDTWDVTPAGAHFPSQPTAAVEGGLLPLGPIPAPSTSSPTTSSSTTGSPDKEPDKVEGGAAEETEGEVVDEPQPEVQRWCDLPPGMQRTLAALGYDESFWDGGGKVPADARTWDELSQAERFTVFFSLGYTKDTWDAMPAWAHFPSQPTAAVEGGVPTLGPIPAPSALSPTTSSFTTLSPTTLSFTTLSPTTLSFTTLSPTTSSPITESPTTSSPITQSPMTSSPITQNPTTSSPVTASPTFRPTGGPSSAPADPPRAPDPATVLHDPGLYEDEWWRHLPPEIQQAYSVLGYTECLWDNGMPVASNGMDWDELTEDMREAADIVGYTERAWGAKEGQASDPPDPGACGGAGAGADVAGEEARHSAPVTPEELYHDEDWADLPPDIQSAYVILGYNQEFWDRGAVKASCGMSWGELSEEERRAAEHIGYTEDIWCADSSDAARVAIPTDAVDAVPEEAVAGAAPEENIFDVVPVEDVYPISMVATSCSFWAEPRRMALLIFACAILFVPFTLGASP